jgi:hypothetical protein
MNKNTFNPGDHVARKSHVHDEGIVLVRAQGPEEKYHVIFAQRTEYNAYPILELLHVDEISLLYPEIHKDPPRSRFKK